MKKRIGVLLAVISTFFLVYVTVFHESSLRLSDITVNQEQFEEIVESRRLSDIALIDELFFDEQKLAYDRPTNTFFYSMIEGVTNASNPYIEKKTSCMQDVSLAVLDAQITAEGIRTSKKFCMVAYSEDAYSVYNIICTTLPIMHLECGGDPGDEKIPVHMTVFDNSRGAVNRFIESDGLISIRGRSSRSYPKKGYRLSLTQESLAGNVRQNRVSLLGMRQDDDWILYAAYNDPEKIRNVFSSNLWKDTCAGDNALGIDNGMEYRYLELFINDQYWGLYALGYPIDERQLGIDMAEGERLYKKGTWDTEDRILSDPKAAVDGYETTVSGGDDWGPLKKYYAKLHSQWMDSEEMYAGIDIDNAIDLYLFINLIQGIDHAGAMDSHSIKNLFISFHNSDNREKALYTPWDMDITWGQRWTGNMESNMVEPYGIECSQNVVIGLGNLQALMLDDDKIWSLILEKYKGFRQELWSEENLNKMLDVLEDDIYMSGAYIRDRERWPDGSYRDSDRKLDDFRNYVAERLNEMDAYYARIEEAVADGSAENVFIVRSLQYKDFLKSDFVLISGGEELYEGDDDWEFLEYIGVDMERLRNGADMVVLSGNGEGIEYYNIVNAMDGIDTCIGHIDIEEDVVTGKQFLYVDGVIWHEMDRKSTLNLMFRNGDAVSKFDFSREYVMWSRAVEQGEVHTWYEKLEENGYDLLIEIVNHDIIAEERFQAAIKEFGIDVNAVSQDTDFIAISDMGEHVTILDKSHSSGTRCDTVLGELSVFYNDTGGYGVYMNTNECMIVSSGENDNVDIRVSVMESIPYRVVWCPTFMY